MKEINSIPGKTSTTCEQSPYR